MAEGSMNKEFKGKLGLGTAQLVPALPRMSSLPPLSMPCLSPEYAEMSAAAWATCPKSGVEMPTNTPTPSLTAAARGAGRQM